MPTIAENAATISMARMELTRQLNKVCTSFTGGFPFETCLGRVCINAELSAGVIHFYIRTPDKGKLTLHYDPYVDEFLVDGCTVATTLKGLTTFLDEVGMKLRSLIGTVE